MSFSNFVSQQADKLALSATVAGSLSVLSAAGVKTYKSYGDFLIFANAFGK